MECSWKTVLLLVCASLGVQYTAIRTLRDSLSGPCQGPYRCQSRHFRDSRWRALCDDSWMPVDSPRKHILLFATTRSGSSFTGQLLNQHPGIFYVFEPLYHVQQAFTNSSSRLRRTLDRRSLLGAYRDLLLNLYTCDLHFMENYIRPEPRTTSPAPSFAEAPAMPSAPLPCAWKQGIEHVAIKTVRVPEVGDLRTLTEDPRLDLKIIHLVRDPRAILASRMMAFSDQFRAWKIWNATGRQPRYVDLTQITSTCKDMAASAATGLQTPAWLRGRYLLVRYEDLAFNPKDKATEIYSGTTGTQPPETPERQRRAGGFVWALTSSGLCRICATTLWRCWDTSRFTLQPISENLSHSLVEHRTFQPVK
ncbi:hypothetical protein KUCAC02_021297 [Chaenocephalus aceratus]|uniref:Uncharacterized protein n=1 Tax=Chaenocephalus aceratus TaxID=36190 RepID=A0ACB9XFP3_CHAAC|nr:hypothetical protein KUCAC02_021297 [Chaenocephalus aceratus]